MPPRSAQSVFRIVSGALALAEERESVSLTQCAGAFDIDRAELIELLRPVIYLEFRDSMGEVVTQVDAFDLDPDTDMLHVRGGHWLRDWDASGPGRDAALRLFVTAAVYQATGDGSVALDGALTKLRQMMAIDLVVPTDRPAALGVVDDAFWSRRSLRFRYTKHKDDVATDREVLPYDVYGQWGHWFVAGPEVGADVVKRWRVDRMSSATVGTVEFDPPDEPPERGDWFDLSELRRTVTVRVPETRVAALPQPFEELSREVEPDGRVRLELAIAGDRHLDHLIVSLGPDGELIAPEDLHDRRRARAAALLAIYE
jgi:predicted DNA-binding transcriptional regulator YafY